MMAMMMMIIPTDPDSRTIVSISAGVIKKWYHQICDGQFRKG